MKAVNSSSYSLPSFPNIMIPQFQQLLPLETTLSENWTNIQCMPELISTGNKILSPPMSITPSSIYTDLSECEYQTIELTSSHKYSLSSPPLSIIKSESIDLIDCTSPYAKQDSTMIIPQNGENTQARSKLSCKTTKEGSNFSIEYILSSPFRPPTYDLLKLSHKTVCSIFTKMNSKSSSDRYLHRMVHYEKRTKQEKRNTIPKHSNEPRGLFISYLFGLCSDSVTQRNRIYHRDAVFSADALQQLADIACKLDTRHKKTACHENLLTSKQYDLLCKQCHSLIRQIYRKLQKKQVRKRLMPKVRSIFKSQCLQFSLSIFNAVRIERNMLLYGSYHSDYHILTSDIRKVFLKSRVTRNTIKQSMCFYLKPDQVESNTEILIPHRGLLYEAVTERMDGYDDLLLVRLNRERQIYLIPVHDLCRLACPKMVPKDYSVLSKGSRVCAYWSTSLRGLHPAKVGKFSSDIEESPLITLMFDDGDTGLIKLNEIRLLPDNYDSKSVDLEEWRVSSSQILSMLPTTRRTSHRKSSSASSSSGLSMNRKEKRKRIASSSTVAPQWTLNSQDSTIRRQDNKQIIHVGDCIILHGADKSLSYIGKVLKFYHKKSTEQDVVRLKWYYSPQETPCGFHENDLPGALYESTHVDDNTIATIRYKGTIYASYDDYVKQTDYGKNRKETDFYLVGQYNPTSGKLRRYDDKK